MNHYDIRSAHVLNTGDETVASVALVAIPEDLPKVAVLLRDGRAVAFDNEEAVEVGLRLALAGLGRLHEGNYDEQDVKRWDDLLNQIQEASPTFRQSVDEAYRRMKAVAYQC